MKITEKERQLKGLQMVEEIAADALSGKPNSVMSSVYRIIHSLRNKQCRRNHSGWLEGVDAAVLADRKRKKGKN